MIIAEMLDPAAPRWVQDPGSDTSRASDPPILIIPGIHGSGPTHWQSAWERALPNAERVEQSDWARPRLADWTAALAEAVRRRPGAVLVAHSLGCALVAHFARISGGRGVGAALLVAPADVDAESAWRRELRGFGPMPREPFSFPSTIAASQDDPFIALDRAKAFAKAWGSRLVDLGRAGHVNVKSGHGPWPEGLLLLEQLRATIDSHAQRVG
ncbi:MAG TPA: alpha/beta hydrolase [Caulobacteraceae bacterium]|jgi:hypothetical protein|nr:alpha/beta hydrolase [Caulobacteraceae bacterium]